MKNSRAPLKGKRTIESLDSPQARTYRCKHNMPWRPRKTKSLSDPAPTARHSESATHQIHSNAAPLPLFASDAKPMARWGACLPYPRGGLRRNGKFPSSPYRCRHSVYWELFDLVVVISHYMSIYDQLAVEKTDIHQFFHYQPRNLPHNPRSQPSPSISEHNSPAIVCGVNPGIICNSPSQHHSLFFSLPKRSNYMHNETFVNNDCVKRCERCHFLIHAWPFS